jgi:hypothetical protein
MALHRNARQDLQSDHPMSSADAAGVGRGPSRDGSGAGGSPFWARARIDRSTVGAATTLAYAVAQHWVPDDAAARFRRAVGLAAVVATRAGSATLNLWEDPGELVCHIARSAPAPGPSLSRPDRVGSDISPGRVVVCLRQHEVTVRLTL